MQVNGITLVDADPWQWHVMYSERIGAREGRVTIEVFDAVDYHKRMMAEGKVPARHPEHDGKVFDTVAEAAAYLIEHGLMRPQEPGDAFRPGPHIKTMEDPDDHQGYEEYLRFGWPSGPREPGSA